MKLSEKFGMAAAMVIATALSAQAQLTSPLPTSPTTTMPNLEKANPSLDAEAMIFQSAIDPAEYHVGPGDVLQVRLWTGNESLQAFITPDLTLNIPRVGTFDARGKTLAQLKEEVYAKADVVFHTAAERSRATGAPPPVTVSLLQPRRIYVKVAGDVLHPDIYATNAGTRADFAVALANKASTEGSATSGQDVKEQQREQEALRRTRPYFGVREEAPASQRYISITHGDGSSDFLDLLRYNATHDPKASPLLREGDVVYVPYRDPYIGAIGIYGAVKAPGDYEYVQTDSLLPFIRYAFGLQPNADSTHVELTRATPDGRLHTTAHSLGAIATGREPDVPLLPGDRIVVPSYDIRVKAAVVSVRGEVERPGIVPIVDGKTKLSEVIKSVGGFRETAGLNAATIIRRGYEQTNSVGSPNDNTAIARLSNFQVTDTANFNRQLLWRTPTVVVDMPRLFLRGDSSADVMLRDGDQIVVPVQPSTVYVYGFVNRPGFVAAIPSGRLSDYIAEAGGYAEGAVQSRTRVIKADSKAWLHPDETVIQPGDEIYVPKEPDYSETYSLTMASTIVGIAGILIGITDFLLRIFKKQ
jgi:protein involved in polysaccharide export with SLBB domain